MFADQEEFPVSLAPAEATIHLASCPPAAPRHTRAESDDGRR
jgi:hypothetical protein